MLKTVKIDTINSENINIALLKTEHVNMLQNIEIDRKTGDLPENVILNIGESVKTSPAATGVLNITNNNPDILVTDLHIKDNDDEFPLWYVHQLKNYVYNETLVSRTIKRRLSGNNKIIANITESIEDQEPETIIKNSIQIETNSGTPLSENNNFRIDYINRSIEILSEYDTSTVFIITAWTIKPSIVLIENGNSVDLNNYRSEYEFVYGNNQHTLTGVKKHLFKVNILTSLINSNNVTYSIIYNRILNGSLNECTEILKSVPVFRYTDNMPAYREYQLLGQTIKVKGASINHLHFVMFNTERSELVTIDQTDRIKNELWHVVITPGSFTNSGNTYTVVEKNTYRFIDNLYRLEHIYLETAHVVNSKQIKTRFNNLLVKTDGDGIPTNIAIYINNTLEANNIISDFDAENGFFFLNKTVSVIDDIKISYVYKLKTIPYKFIQLNPSKRFSSLNTTDQMMKNYIVFMLPYNVLDTTKQRSIFHVEYYKYPSLYTDKNDIEISETAMIAYLNGTNPETSLSNIYDVVDTTYLSNISLPVIEPFILGTVSTINTSTTSSITALDIRVRGGGLPETFDIQKLEKELPGALYNIDICYLDGRPYPANNVYVVRLPQSYIDEYLVTLEEFDKILVRTLRTLQADKKDTFKQTYTLDKIKGVVKRFLPASAHIKFEIT